MGDTIEAALKSIGVTPERVERWLGRPCGCRARKDKLNQLGRWAARVFRGKPHTKEELDGMMEDGSAADSFGGGPSR